MVQLCVLSLGIDFLHEYSSEQLASYGADPFQPPGHSLKQAQALKDDAF